MKSFSFSILICFRLRILLKAIYSFPLRFDGHGFVVGHGNGLGPAVDPDLGDRGGGGVGDLEVDADGALDVLLPADRLLEDATDGRVRSRVVEGALACSGSVGGGHRSTGGGVLEPEETGKLDRELVAERHPGVASVVVDVEFEVVALPDFLAIGDGVSRLVHVFEKS